MFRLLWVVGLTCVSLVACDSRTGRDTIIDDDTDDLGADVADEPDVEDDSAPVTGPAQGEAFGLATSGGVATSPSYRFEYTLAAPVVTGPAASESYANEPALVGPSPARDETPSP